MLGTSPTPSKFYPTAKMEVSAEPVITPAAPGAMAAAQPLALEHAPTPEASTIAKPLPKTKSMLALLAAYRQRRAPPTLSSEPGGRYDQDRDTYILDTGKPIVLRLADGTIQKVSANSTENRLYTFLATPTIQVDSVNRTNGWINFN